MYASSTISGSTGKLLLTDRVTCYLVFLVETRMFVSLPFEEFLRGVFLYLVSHVPRVWPRARYLFLLASPRAPNIRRFERYIPARSLLVSS